MKVYKSLLIFLIGFICLGSITACSQSKTVEEKRKLRKEEEQIALYLVNHYQDVKKIKFDKFHRGGFGIADSISVIVNNDSYIKPIIFNDDSERYSVDYNTWRFNNKGQLIDKNGNVVTNTAKGNANTLILETKTRMLRYYGMKSLLTESGGGLNSNEQIFLDSEQATIGANALVNAAQQVLDQIKIEKQRGVEEVESLFETTKSPFMVSSLSPDEIRSAFEAGGVTYISVVENVESSLQNKLNKASQILDEMTKLKDKIAAGINKKLEEDISLAGEFNQWRNLN